ncbi:hypothetical protein [Nocardioides humi]|uniref:Uncharacterized protein n=1 Tax=Nocardioides humi TaxID=449461 RepID=A0ABN2AXP9_9ACTN|nr:hypothetical protein [Nocardioides humi]
MAGELWHLDRAGRRHEIEISDAGLGKRLVWRVDGEQIAERRTHDERVQLTPEEDGGGAVFVRLPRFLGPARRVTWLEEPAELAGAGVVPGGVDFRPEPGSRADRRERRMLHHPRLHTFLETGGAVLGVLLSLLVAWLLARVVIAIPWPDIPWPSIPWPDIRLPRIPWPDIDLPTIPWPDLALPAWLRWLLDNAKYVVPVIVAFAVARAEVRRRRRQEQLRRQAANGTENATENATANGGQEEGDSAPAP